VLAYPPSITRIEREVGGPKDNQVISTRKIENLNVDATTGSIGTVKTTVTDSVGTLGN
jgi:hypothetical protein